MRFIFSSLGITTHVRFFCIMCYKIHGDSLINLYDKQLIKKSTNPGPIVCKASTLIVVIPLCFIT